MTSPYNLIYEDPIVQDSDERGWRVLAAAILRTRAKPERARLVMHELFEKWPTPGNLANASETEVSMVCHSIGLDRTRAQRLIAMSRGWVNKIHEHLGVELLEGVGLYGYQVYALFHEHRTEFIWPDDVELSRYRNWRASC